MNNPFDLQRRTEYTSKAQSNYVEVPPDKWVDLEPRTYIKFLKTNEKWQQGFIMGKDLERKLFYIQADLMDSESFKTTIYFSNIVKILKKVKESPVSSESINYASQIKNLQERIIALEQNKDNSDKLALELVGESIMDLERKYNDLQQDFESMVAVMMQITQKINSTS